MIENKTMVQCEHCGCIIQKRYAKETIWNINNGGSLKWYYCNRCEEGVFNGGKRNAERKSDDC